MQAVAVDVDPDSTLVVTLRGEIDFTNSASVAETIRAAVLQQRPTLVRVGLADVTFLDSSGIGALVQAMRAAVEVRAAYRVERPIPEVRAQLGMTGLLEAFGLAGPGD
jgi:anti-sigma B factor antagonist